LAASQAKQISLFW